MRTADVYIPKVKKSYWSIEKVKKLPLYLAYQYTLPGIDFVSNEE